MNVKTRNAPTRLDLWIVRLDRTADFHIDDSDAPHIEAIWGVYLYDRARRVHCCELTPSYWLEWLYDTVECCPDVPEETAEQLYGKYENHPDAGGGIYLHCHEVEALRGQHHHGRERVHTTYDEVFEAVADHYRANHVF